jgi:hypothetical protein
VDYGGKIYYLLYVNIQARKRTTGDITLFGRFDEKLELRYGNYDE